MLGRQIPKPFVDFNGHNKVCFQQGFAAEYAVITQGRRSETTTTSGFLSSPLIIRGPQTKKGKRVLLRNLDLFRPGYCSCSFSKSLVCLAAAFSSLDSRAFLALNCTGGYKSYGFSDFFKVFMALVGAWPIRAPVISFTLQLFDLVSQRLEHFRCSGLFQSQFSAFLLPTFCSGFWISG